MTTGEARGLIAAVIVMVVVVAAVAWSNGRFDRGVQPSAEAVTADSVVAKISVKDTCDNRKDEGSPRVKKHKKQISRKAYPPRSPLDEPVPSE